jgi:hypothetical protein
MISPGTTFSADHIDGLDVVGVCQRNPACVVSLIVAQRFDMVAELWGIARSDAPPPSAHVSCDALVGGASDVPSCLVPFRGVGPEGGRQLGLIGST